jgi:hypothetical protein
MSNRLKVFVTESTLKLTAAKTCIQLKLFLILITKINRYKILIK